MALLIPPGRAAGCALLPLVFLPGCAEDPRPVAPTPSAHERGTTEASAGDVDDVPPSLVTVVLSHPCQTPGAQFGSSVAIGDVDGVGGVDVVVGAAGEGAVYVARYLAGEYEIFATYQASGPVACPVSRADGLFGGALAVANLDGGARSEIVVGAPQTAGMSASAGTAYLLTNVGDTLGSPSFPVLALPPAADEEGRYGNSLATGDYDGDGQLDVAVGAPSALVDGVSAGVVVVHSSPLGSGSTRTRIANPFPVVNGNFGHALATADTNGDGIDDLVVSAVGNTVDGQPGAGQILVFPGPLAPGRFVLLDDPVPVQGDQPRFGMHVAGRGPRVAIGSPRKDWNGVKDSGLGVVLRDGARAELFPHPDPFPNAILGFRVVLANLIGDERVDLAVATLPQSAVPAEAPPASGARSFPNRGFFVWNAAEPGTPLHVSAAEGSADHFCQGVAAGDLRPGGREELVLGDPSWDRPGQYRKDDVGRVVVHLLVH